MGVRKKLPAIRLKPEQVKKPERLAARAASKGSP